MSDWPDAYEQQAYREGFEAGRREAADEIHFYLRGAGYPGDDQDGGTGHPGPAAAAAAAAAGECPVRLTQEFIAYTMALFYDRVNTIKMAGGIAYRDVVNGDCVPPKDWVFDVYTQYYVPPNLFLEQPQGDDTQVPSGSQVQS